MTAKQALEKSYRDFAPLSQRWKKEFRMHLNTLKILEKHLGGFAPLEKFADSVGGEKNKISDRNLIPPFVDCRSAHSLTGFAGKRILDVGCGLGILTQALRHLGAGAEGADKHVLVEWGLEGIEAAWQELGLKVTVGDFFSMDCGGGYDAVVSENMLEHLPYTQKNFFEKTYAALRPGGINVLSTPNMASFLKRARMFFGKSPCWDLEDFFLRKQPFGHFREFTADELRKMAELSGFKVLSVCARNIYFKRKWLADWHKFPQVLSWLLSSIFSAGRDTLYLVAQKLN